MYRRQLGWTGGHATAETPVALLITQRWQRRLARVRIRKGRIKVPRAQTRGANATRLPRTAPAHLGCRLDDQPGTVSDSTPDSLDLPRRPAAGRSPSPPKARASSVRSRQSEDGEAWTLALALRQQPRRFRGDQSTMLANHRFSRTSRLLE